MAHKCVFLESAEEDLWRIGSFIAQDNPTRALEWMELLEERAKSLVDMPMRGRRYKKQYRMLTVDNGYQIFYRVDQSEKKVVIVHFYSPYQNYDEDLKEI